jgi:hypothetical protein
MGKTIEQIWIGALELAREFGPDPQRLLNCRKA